MADLFFGMNRGDFDGEMDNVQVGTSTNSTDLEVRISTGAGTITVMTAEDAVKLLKIIGQYIALIEPLVLTY